IAGGHTAVYQQGVARPVLHVDVISLYPSIMLTQGIAPAADTLGAFARLLRDLRDFRVAAKQLMRVAESDAERRHLGALQQTFKILINSFYGYLGFSPGHWNDFEAANRVTAEGRVVVTTIVDRLQALGATVVEIDTDGVYFVPPADARDPAGEARLLASLAGRREEIAPLVSRWKADFAAHRVPARLFMKTETLQDSVDLYRVERARGLRNPSAAYELALGAGRPYQPGDQVSYYLTGRGTN